MITHKAKSTTDVRNDSNNDCKDVGNADEGCHAAAAADDDEDYPESLPFHRLKQKLLGYIWTCDHGDDRQNMTSEAMQKRSQLMCVCDISTRVTGLRFIVCERQRKRTYECIFRFSVSLINQLCSAVFVIAAAVNWTSLNVYYLILLSRKLFFSRKQNNVLATCGSICHLTLLCDWKVITQSCTTWYFLLCSGKMRVIFKMG